MTPSAATPAAPALLAAFESATIEPSRFDHRAHLAVIHHLLETMPFGLAGERFLAALRRFAEAHGKTQLVHATITWAYVALVNERMQRGDAGASFDEFLARNPDLLDHRSGAFSSLYDRATLDGDLARRAFVLPRRGPLPT